MFDKILEIGLLIFNWFGNSAKRSRKRYLDLRTQSEVRRAVRAGNATIDKINNNDDAISFANDGMHDKLNKPKTENTRI